MTYLEKNSIIIKQICENESELGKKSSRNLCILLNARA